MKKAEKSVGKFMFSKKRAQKGPVPCLLFVARPTKFLGAFFSFPPSAKGKALATVEI